MNRSNVGANTNSVQILLDSVVLLVAFIINLLCYIGRIKAQEYPALLALFAVFVLIFIMSNKEKYLYNVTLFTYIDRIQRKITVSFLLAGITILIFGRLTLKTEDSRLFVWTYLLLTYMLVSVKMLFHTNLNNALMAKNKPRTALVGDESTFEKFFYFLNKTSIVIDFVGYIAWSKNDYDAAATGADKNGDNEVTVDNTDADNSNVAGTDAVINAYGTGVSNMSADKNGDNKTESDKTGVGGVTENDTEKPGTGKTKYIGYMEKLEEVLHEHRIDQLYIMQRDTDQPDSFQPVIDMCMDLGVTVRMVVDIYKKRNASSYVSSVGTYPIITYHTITLNTHEQVIKRIFDIAASIFGIIVFSPIMLATAIAIKLDSKGPVLFKQTRVGKNGRLFKIYKFRSMFVDAEERKAELMKQNQMQNGPMFKMKDDPRITKVGKFIRKTSIDELPQFFNILGGSMSLVGTRPPTVDEVEKYERNQWRRISIKPGLTGMWQVSGRSAITDFNKVVELDTEYIDKWSLGLDFIIILKTVRVLLLRKGAF